MVYEYHCQRCSNKEDVMKPASESDTVEKCQMCGYPMKKAITRPQLSFGTFKPDYYHTFGKYINSKAELNDELAKYRLETGNELIEVGNEKIKPEKKDWKPDKEQAVRELKHRVKHG